MPEGTLEFSKLRLVVMAAPNGARRTRDDHPALPMTANQLAREAAKLAGKGVSVLHLHVRDRKGRHTLDPGAYREAISAIRAAVGDGLVIQVTSEAVGVYRPAQQMAMVRELRPEAVSLALRELCPDESGEAEAGAFYEFLQKERIWPQHILYTPDDVARFERLRQKGLFAEDRPFSLLVVGDYAGKEPAGTPALDHMQKNLDTGCLPWAACSFGPEEQQVMREVAARGGHVRLGFENNLWLPDGNLAHDNSALVGAFISSLPPGSRAPATANEVRKRFLTKN